MPSALCSISACMSVDRSSFSVAISIVPRPCAFECELCGLRQRIDRRRPLARGRIALAGKHHLEDCEALGLMLGEVFAPALGLWRSALDRPHLLSDRPLADEAFETPLVQIGPEIAQPVLALRSAVIE